MNAKRKLALVLFVLIVVILMAAIIRFDNEVRRQNMSEIGDKLSQALRSQLGREQEDALRTALVLAQNEGIIHALREDDEDRGYEVLSAIMDEIQRHTNTLVRSQIITADYHLFARSWDNIYSGMPLEDSRSDLDYFKTRKKPRVSIEVGRRLGIKATVPVLEKNQLLGFVEVLQFFDVTTAFFRDLGIDLYVLMDDSYYNTAVLMQNNPTVGKYIIANRAYNSVHLKMLERLDFRQLRQEHFLQNDDHSIFFEPMRNVEGTVLGAFVMVMPKTEVAHFGSRDEELSLLINFSRRNLYDIVKKEQLEEQIYRSRYDKALLYLKDTVSEEDRELYIQEAQEILESYTKEELIALILKHKSVRNIKGEIR